MALGSPDREPLRLASGGGIDRTRSLRFTFDGKAYAGHPGDTLASALLANGERLVGRSFKYHRPRGIFSAGAEEPNALIELHGRGQSAEWAERARRGRAARTQYARDHGRALRRARRREPEPLAVAQIRRA